MINRTFNKKRLVAGALAALLAAGSTVFGAEVRGGARGAPVRAAPTAVKTPERSAPRVVAAPSRAAPVTRSAPAPSRVNTAAPSRVNTVAPSRGTTAAQPRVVNRTPSPAPSRVAPAPSPKAAPRNTAPVIAPQAAAPKVAPVIRNATPRVVSPASAPRTVTPSSAPRVVSPASGERRVGGTVTPRASTVTPGPSVRPVNRIPESSERTAGRPGGNTLAANGNAEARFGRSGFFRTNGARSGHGLTNSWTADRHDGGTWRLPPGREHGFDRHGFADGRHDGFDRDHDRGWRHGGIHFGFGFYTESLWRPQAYPVYYPVYTSPVVVETPGYVVPEAAPEVYDTPEVGYEPAGVQVAPAVAGGGTQAVPSVPAAQLERMISDGTRLFHDGDYQQAANLFGRAAAADPRNADARLAYGMAEFALGDYRLAAAAIRQGVQNSPEVVNTAMDLRDNYGKVSDFDQQFERLAQRVESEPGDGDAMLVLGFVYHFVGDRTDSEQVFQQIKDQFWGDAELADLFLNAREAPANASEAGE